MYSLFTHTIAISLHFEVSPSLLFTKEDTVIAYYKLFTTNELICVKSLRCDSQRVHQAVKTFWSWIVFIISSKVNLNGRRPTK